MISNEVVKSSMHCSRIWETELNIVTQWQALAIGLSLCNFNYNLGVHKVAFWWHLGTTWMNYRLIMTLNPVPETALRVGSEGVFQNFSGGGFENFRFLGVSGISLPFSHPWFESLTQPYIKIKKFQLKFWYRFTLGPAIKFLNYFPLILF